MRVSTGVIKFYRDGTPSGTMVIRENGEQIYSGPIGPWH